jgi:hypothetical protein
VVSEKKLEMWKVYRRQTTDDGPRTINELTMLGITTEKREIVTNTPCAVVC